VAGTLKAMIAFAIGTMEPQNGAGSGTMWRLTKSAASQPASTA
jgi:hypothetical protein